jgi:hypothetical protein
MPRLVKFTDEKGETQEVELRADIARLVDQVETMNDSDGVFFQRQLEAIEASTYDVLYPDLEARECFITNTYGGAGAQQLTYRSYDRVGKAQVINARATDLPKSDISGKEYSIGVLSVGVAYDYDIDEIAAAQMSGMPLEARKVMAARRGYEELINQVSWFGSKETSLNGFFSPENLVARTKVADGAGGSSLWADKTPDEVLADLNEACSAMFAGTKKIHRPAELWLPVALWNYIRSTPRSALSDTTILSYWLANNEFINDKSNVKVLNILDEVVAETAGDAGTTITDGVFVLVNHKTPEGQETVRIRETLPLQFLPVQLHGLVYEVPGRGRFAGVEVTYPRAMDIYFGI